MSMASSNGNPDSLVVLRFHNFRAKRIRHWWNLLGVNDHASIKGVFGKFSSLMRLRVDRGLLRLSLPSGIRPIVAFPSGRWISFLP